ncbi:snRNA-activating protein complex subunit 1-like [Ctenocephalides felis]|uniref:snRNA-activating protein complex subunit 1-like n=1 Tax=Ctenocephalides felis TaxID=7515 RepID=UPI000E6E324C|nr:snRNA-activating protein complex subunit 1-like [Ctenocephalides felis]
MCAVIPQFAKGFREDATRIIYNFRSAPESTFKCFSDIWKEMKFAQIFVGRNNAAEVMEISEEFMDVAKYFILCVKDAKVKIGGLFLLYSLYYSQPFVEFAKIRLVREEWMHLKGWWLTLNRTIDDEPIYMFLKLYYDNAFKFVFDSHCYGLEKSFYKYFKELPHTLMIPHHIMFESYSIKPQERVELNEISEIISSFREDYKMRREQLKFPTKLEDSDISAVLHNCFDEGPKTPLKQITSKEEESGCETDANEGLGSKRKALKEKAFGVESTGRYLQNFAANTSSFSTNYSSECDMSEQDTDEE